MKWIQTPNGCVNLEAASCVYIEPTVRNAKADHDFWTCCVDGHPVKFGTQEECLTYLDALMRNVEVVIFAMHDGHTLETERAQ